MSNEPLPTSPCPGEGKIRVASGEGVSKMLLAVWSGCVGSVGSGGSEVEVGGRRLLVSGAALGGPGR